MNTKDPNWSEDWFERNGVSRNVGLVIRGEAPEGALLVRAVRTPAKRRKAGLDEPHRRIVHYNQYSEPAEQRPILAMTYCGVYPLNKVEWTRVKERVTCRSCRQCL